MEAGVHVVCSLEDFLNGGSIKVLTGISLNCFMTAILTSTQAEYPENKKFSL